MRVLDVHKVERRIRKLQQLVQLSKDPELVELLLETVSPESHKAPEPAKKAAKSSGGANGKTQRGELEQVARRAIHALPATFNSGDLIRAMKASGYVFTAKDEGIAISGVLKRLVKKKVLKRMDDGKSKRNALYGLAA